MITRIIKFKIKPDGEGLFEELVKQFKDELMSFDGLHHIDILREKDNHMNVFIIMIFNTEAKLDLFRRSELNKVIKQRLKDITTEAPLAWMVETFDIEEANGF